METTYKFRVTLFTTWYDEDEKRQEQVYGTRTHVGTEDTVTSFARRTRTRATEARIERISIHQGAKFKSHEIKTFTIGLDPR